MAFTRSSFRWSNRRTNSGPSPTSHGRRTGKRRKSSSSSKRHAASRRPHDIARCAATLDSVTGFSYGFGDYTKAIGATGRPDSVRDRLAHTTVEAAAIGGLDPLASVYQDFRDEDGLRASAERAEEIGFVGMKAIHPGQIETLNSVFTPTAEDVERARTFVETFDGDERDSLVVDGVFLDTAIVDQYRTILDRNEEVSS